MPLRRIAPYRPSRKPHDPRIAHLHRAAGHPADDDQELATISRDIRGDDYGKLEGYWSTDIGPLNQVVHLWTYTDLNERARLRAELAKNERWVKDYMPLNKDILLRQDIRLMNPVIGPVAPAEAPNVYELRDYRTKVGAARQWAGLITKAMPAREKYSKPVGLWITEAGQPNEVVHIWAYKDLNHRAQVRAAASADPEWQAFLKEVGAARR